MLLNVLFISGEGMGPKKENGFGLLKIKIQACVCSLLKHLIYYEEWEGGYFNAMVVFLDVVLGPYDEATETHIMSWAQAAMTSRKAGIKSNSSTAYGIVLNLAFLFRILWLTRLPRV